MACDCIFDGEHSQHCRTWKEFRQQAHAAAELGDTEALAAATYRMREHVRQVFRDRDMQNIADDLRTALADIGGTRL